MPPMEPGANRPTSGLVPTSFYTQAISSTAPVLTEEVVSSPEPTGLESVPIFTSGLVCPPGAVASSGHEPAPMNTSSNRSLFSPPPSLDREGNLLCTSEGLAPRHDAQCQNLNQAACASSTIAFKREDNDNELISRCSSFRFRENADEHEHYKEDTLDLPCGLRCSRRHTPAISCRRSGPLKCRASGGSSGSVSSRSSSGSPGSYRRYSSSRTPGKTSTSTEECMSTNPNTPNTPNTPKNLDRTSLSQPETVFNFPAIIINNNNNNNNDNNMNSFNNSGTNFGCDAGGLDLDLDLDGDDDVFCSDIGDIPTAAVSKPTMHANLNDICSGLVQNNDKSIASSSTSINSSSSITTTTSSSNNNSLAGPALLGSTFLSRNCHCREQQEMSNETDPRLGKQLCTAQHAVSPGGDPMLPVLLSDALEVCQKDELEGDRDNNNNNNSPGGELSSSEANPALLNAALEAYQSGQITPLLKHELKWVIQLRRLSQGKEEMEVSFDPPTTSQMSEAELTRAERRRKQNRIAARKFRQKRKSVEEQLLQTIQALKETNSSLEQKADQLRREKQALMEFIADHLLVCPFLSHLQLETLAIGDDAVP